ncbi:MAG: response regulator [Anaerolineae bacterium]|nr:response regulator [Anaerolineae bacterium]MDW8173669.1 response regulator [Anaerolineae bacterium]
MRVLYIEDDPNNRLLVRRILMAEGFQVLEAENATQGINLALQDPPDLILMDISMPGVDGLTATRQIRSLPQIAHLKIIALTANAMTGDREMILKAGCDGYISKPINIDTFVDELRQFTS